MSTVDLPEESSNVRIFRSWFASNGGYMHPHVHYSQVSSGFNIVAKNAIEKDTEVISCPFNLIVTPSLARNALVDVLRLGLDGKDPFAGWTEMQLMSTYIVIHWMDYEGGKLPSNLQHLPYLDTLPEPSKLLTPLHFTPPERVHFRGSNIFGATTDRENAWMKQHRQCQALVSSANTSWGAEFTWQKYLTAMTYISSRAFPSTLLDSFPSLVATSESYPILLPGVDALNHARATPVSWITTHSKSGSSTDEEVGRSKISLVLHDATPAHAELLNNYGPKPNAELILGYGFTLENNPDDTIVLKLGGATSAGAPERKQWEVGRGAKGFEPLWEYVLNDMRRRRKEEDEEEGMEVDDDEETAAIGEVQDVLQAAMQLDGMVELLVDKLPSTSTAEQSVGLGIIRSEVARMLCHYIEGATIVLLFFTAYDADRWHVLFFAGQRDILESIRGFAMEKHENIIRWAKERGLPIVEEEDEAD
ncbi:hypothetical protein EIP91_003040 [Steccherinum ochraceum]|uniref:SET domain-containing protein n=1 Tax=Steccherinum ochraceum TaxID=92696 RepID=A0A4V2MW74_9APHY|nr:hypothetical protein EIP91_003040 [Steccherinum ochraceum]